MSRSIFGIGSKPISRDAELGCDDAFCFVPREIYGRYLTSLLQTHRVGCAPRQRFTSCTANASRCARPGSASKSSSPTAPVMFGHIAVLATGNEAPPNAHGPCGASPWRRTARNGRRPRRCRADRGQRAHHGRLCLVAFAGAASRPDHRDFAAGPVAAAAPLRRRRCGSTPPTYRLAPIFPMFALVAPRRRARRWPDAGTRLALGDRRAAPVHPRHLAKLAGADQAPLPPPRPRLVGRPPPPHRARDRRSACAPPSRPAKSTSLPARFRQYHVQPARRQSELSPPPSRRSRNRCSVAKIVACTGVSVAPRDSSNPVLRNLLEQGLIRPDPIGIGLDVTPDCAVIGRSGKASDKLFAIGPLTRGRFWEIIAIPDIRHAMRRACAADLQSHAGRG